MQFRVSIISREAYIFNAREHYVRLPTWLLAEIMTSLGGFYFWDTNYESVTNILILLIIDGFSTEFVNSHKIRNSYPK